MNKKLTYTVVGTFVEKNRRHIDIYSNLTAKKAESALAEHLDCFVDRNGNVVRPTFEATAKALESLADFEDYVKKEFERQKKAYAAWSLCRKFISAGNPGVNAVPYGDQESITVEAV